MKKPRFTTLTPMPTSLRLLGLMASLGSATVFAQTNYDVNAAFGNGALWTNNATWNPSTGTPGALDSINIVSTTLFTSGNAINVNGASRTITDFAYDGGSGRSIIFNQGAGTTAGLALNVNGTFTKNGDGLVAFTGIGLGGSGTSINLRNGGIGFVSNNDAGANLSTFTLDKRVDFSGPVAARVPSIVMRSTGSQNGTLNLNGGVQFQSANALRIATFHARQSGAGRSIININSNVTNTLADREVTFLLEQGATTGRAEFNFAAGGTNTYNASANSRFVLGRLAGAGQNAIADLTTARANGFGAVSTLQVGDATHALNASTADLRVLGTASGVTIGQAINVNGYTVTTGSESYTLGGTHASGLVTFGGLITQAKDVTLSSANSGAITAFTGGIATGGRTATVGGNGIVALSGALSGGGTVLIADGATFTPGTNGIDVGSVTFSGGTNLTLGSGSTTRLHIADSASFDQILGVNALSLAGGLSLEFGSTFGSDASLGLFTFGSKLGNLSGISIAGSYVGSLTRVGETWSGTIDGVGFIFAQDTGVLNITAIPEPSSFSLLAAACAVGFVATRRRRQTRS